MIKYSLDTQGDVTVPWKIAPSVRRYVFLSAIAGTVDSLFIAKRNMSIPLGISTFSELRSTDDRGDMAKDASMLTAQHSITTQLRLPPFLSQARRANLSKRSNFACLVLSLQKLVYLYCLRGVLLTAKRSANVYRQGRNKVRKSKLFRLSWLVPRTQYPLLNPWARVVHHCLGVSRTVLEALGAVADGLANRAKGSVRFTSLSSMTVNCVYTTAMNVGTNFHPNKAELSALSP